MSSSNMPPKTPSGERTFPALYHPSLRWEMMRARWIYATREAFNSRVVYPLEDRLFAQWIRQGRLAGQVEAVGLPRRSVENQLNRDLDIRADPSKLLRLISIPKSFPIKSERRKVASVFLWQSEWDLTYADFRTTYRYRFIQDIWTNRNALERSEAYVDLNRKLEQGKPFRSHQKGILLNTPEKILEYLNMYIGYMASMQQAGFDNLQGKDRLGVAIDRNGDIVKINRGLHRLAMAQVLGLDEIVVRVRAVHVEWWRQVTQGETGERALQRLVKALPACRPAPEFHR